MGMIYSKRDISAANFLMHEVHCRRNIVLCDRCDEPFPRSQLTNHVQEAHATEPCEMCQASIEKCKIQEHKVSIL